MIPAAARAASSSWRWVVEGGWLTIVKTLPSDAVRTGISRASMHGPSRRAPAGQLEREHPAAARELAGRDLVLGMRREARVPDPADAGLGLEPRGEGRGGRRVALHPEGERGQAAHREERRVRIEAGARVDLEVADPVDEARRAARRRRP